MKKTRGKKTAPAHAASVSQNQKNQNAPQNTRDTRDTRDQLIKAATALFASKGFDGVSVKDLSDKAGVNVSLISSAMLGALPLVLGEFRRRYPDVHLSFVETGSVVQLDALANVTFDLEHDSGFTDPNTFASHLQVITDLNHNGQIDNGEIEHPPAAAGEVRQHSRLR